MHMYFCAYVYIYICMNVCSLSMHKYTIMHNYIYRQSPTKNPDTKTPIPNQKMFQSSDPMLDTCKLMI